MRKRISREEFERMARSPRSRWSDLLDKVGDGDDAYEVPLDKDERNAAGRDKVRRQLRAAATRRGLRIRVLTIKGVMWVQGVE